MLDESSDSRDVLKSLVAEFPHAVRERGYRYVERVKLIERDSKEVRAFVRGGREYLVSLDLEMGDHWCDCPYFEDRGPCKHLWALLVSIAPDLAPRAKPEPPKKWRTSLRGLESELSRLPATRQSIEPIFCWYVIEVTGGRLGRPSIRICPSVRKRRKDGEWGEIKSIHMERSEIATRMQSEDRDILTALAVGSPGSSSYEASYDPLPVFFALGQPFPFSLLEKIVATGRAFVRVMDVYTDAYGRYRNGRAELEPASFDEGEPWRFELKAEEIFGQGGSHRLIGQLVRGVEVMPLPIIVFPSGLWLRQARREETANQGSGDARFGRLEDLQSVPWIRRLSEDGAWEISPGDQAGFLQQLFALPSLPTLDVKSLTEAMSIVEDCPVPGATLRLETAEAGASLDGLSGKMLFDYGGTLVDGDDLRASLLANEGKSILHRDHEAERNFRSELVSVGGVSKRDPRTDETLWSFPPPTFFQAVAALLERGWRVEGERGLFRQASEIDVEVTSGIDWFDLGGGATFGDEKVPLPRLLLALAEGKRFISLGDGSMGLLPEDWLRGLALAGELGKAEQKTIRFDKSQVGLLDALISADTIATNVRCDTLFASAREKLHGFEAVTPVKPAKSFAGTLRDYQKEGLGWLTWLREMGLGGCLADDMGLGKTVQMLAYFERKRKTTSAPSLVVAPRSLIFNWRNEAARFAPKLRVLDHTGPGRKPPGAHFHDYDIILTTYGTLRKDILNLHRIDFDTVVLDEAQAIKNRTTESAKAARLLKARHRFALSGTPIENHLGELASIFEFLNPGMLGRSKLALDRSLRSPSEETRRLLGRALRPYLLRRTKEAVARDLPAKTEQVLLCELEGEQRKMYDELRDHYRRALLGQIDEKGMNESKIAVLEALLRLRQAACHPGLVHNALDREPSAKTQTLFCRLEEVLAEGHKALVFSQFTSFLGIVRGEVKRRGWKHGYLDGKSKNRHALVSEFQEDPACKLFLVSLKAGGVGLNLTAAEYVFLLDPWWNPAVEAQAIDRTHRIGQARPVFAYRLIAADTVEEKILELQAKKRALASAIYDGEDGQNLLRGLRREDVELLLS